MSVVAPNIILFVDGRDDEEDEGYATSDDQGVN